MHEGMLALLARYGVAPVLSDGRWIPRKQMLALAAHPTAPFAYIRWIGPDRSLVDFSRVQVDRTRDMESWARAMTDLKEILSESKAAIIPVGPALAITGMSDMIDEDGNMSEAAKANPYGPQAGLNELLTDLKWYGDVLAAARAHDK